jgi:hypothetical protein
VGVAVDDRHVAMAAVAGWLIRQQGSRARLLLVALYGLTGLVAYDGWRHFGRSYQNLPQADYFTFVEAPYARSGECRSFFLGAEGAKDQLTRLGYLWPLFNLDAVYLSYRLELPTLNGYSGHFPPGWELREPSCSGCYLNAVDHWIRLHKLEKVCVFEYSSRELKPYTPAEIPARWDFIFQSWDTANKPSELSDYSVCTTWAVAGAHLYLLSVLRERLVNTEAAVRLMWQEAAETRPSAHDLDRILHSIRSFPNLLCVRSAVDIGGNVSILGQPSKKFESLLDLGSIHDHSISGVQNRADTR